ncbi:Spc24 subunit of Ndc80-domain-containing protein [Xylariaceae sp. FL0804]|nr:Spc24 subunit of Ndc80-domain-containing protein [Xylariaceae sp. FL0804]
MLLDEDPATLIHHTINNFNINPDKSAISRIQSSLGSLEQEREKRVRDAESALKKLSRQLGTQQAQYEELAAAHSSAAHASEIARLDTQRFRTAKAASDLEAEAERLSSQHADLAARLQELELLGVDGDLGGGGDYDNNNNNEDEAAPRGGGDPVDDEVLLRLKVYRSLGIDLERDERDGGSGEFCKAVVRNDRKGDVHVVNIDKKFSRFFYANYFWSTL